jgi:uncharacterized protein YbaR (Trm112 family)
MKNKFDKALLEIIVCPKCKKNLTYIEKDENYLICNECRLAYPIKQGIPVMLAEEAIKMDDFSDILKP